MTAQMTQKLRDIFDSMFGIQKGTDKGDIDKIVGNNLTVIPKALQLNISQIGALVAFVKNNVDKPVSNVGVEFGVVDSNVVIPLEIALKKNRHSHSRYTWKCNRENQSSCSDSGRR